MNGDTSDSEFCSSCFHFELNEEKEIKRQFFCDLHLRNEITNGGESTWLLAEHASLFESVSLLSVRASQSNLQRTNGWRTVTAVGTEGTTRLSSP